MNKELKWFLLSLLVMFAAIASFLYMRTPRPVTTQVQTIVNPCKVCGKPLYREELDFYMTTWIGDIPVIIPIYKTILHTCKGR